MPEVSADETAGACNSHQRFLSICFSGTHRAVYTTPSNFSSTETEFVRLLALPHREAGLAVEGAKVFGFNDIEPCGVDALEQLNHLAVGADRRIPTGTGTASDRCKRSRDCHRETLLRRGW